MGNTQQKLQQSQNDEKPEPEETDSDFTCEICIEPVGADNKFKNSSLCKHSFCSDCVAKYIEAKVVEFNVANIDCPALDCKFSLDPLSCRPIISNHVFTKWCDLLCNATVLHHYSNKFVYCPYQDCSALILNECGGEPKQCTCPNCKNKFCFQCKCPWHAGYRCWEKEKFRDRNDVLVGELIEENKWTRCPKCGNVVERNGGCIYIRCRCGSLFCHACGKADKLLCCRQSRDDVHTILYVIVIFILFLLLIISPVVLLLILFC